MKNIKIALCQIKPASDTDNTVEHALEMIQTSAENGADIVTFPEMFYYPYDLSKIRNIVGKENEYLQMLASAAQKHGVYLSTGSMAFSDGEKLYNRSHLIAPDGKILGEYSKCHLFEAKISGVAISESGVFTRGNSLAVIDTPLCKIGIMICFDIRFPEMARLYALDGVELLLVPSVFNNVTGAAHWHTMLRGRAIENQFFVAAASQARNPDSSYCAYGHSMVVGPWGEIIGEALEGEEIVYCTIDKSLIEESKNKLQLLNHRRDDIYNLSLSNGKDGKDR